MWSVCFGAWRSRCCRLVPWTRFVRFSEGRAALIGAEPHKKGACSHHKAHVPMPSVPRACLAVIEAHIILGAQETFLDCPAQPGGGGQFRQCRVRAGISEVIRDGLRITQASTRKQPTGKPFPGRMVEWYPGPFIEPVSFGAFACAERLPILGWQVCYHFAGHGGLGGKGHIFRNMRPGTTVGVI